MNKKEFKYNGHSVELIEIPENVTKGVYPIQIYVDGKDFGCAPTFENAQDIAIECIHD